MSVKFPVVGAIVGGIVLLVGKLFLAGLALGGLMKKLA